MWRGHRKAVPAGELAAGTPGEGTARRSQQLLQASRIAVNPGIGEESLPGRLSEGGRGPPYSPSWHRGAVGTVWSFSEQLRGDGKALSIQTNVSG